MALVPIEQIGQIGIIKDVKPYALQPNAWSDGNNVRFTDQGVQNIQGYREVMQDCPVKVLHLVWYNKTNQKRDYWLAFGIGKTLKGEIHCWDQSNDSWTDVTPVEPKVDPDDEDEEPVNSDLNGSDTVKWSTDFLGMQLIATNGVDLPLKWDLNSNNEADPEERFMPLDMQLSEDVATWEEGIGGPVPKTINVFKSIMIGMNYPEGPTRVWWSSPGGHYTTPTWDYYNKNQDAGDYELNDTKGAIVDGAALAEAFLIYKEDSIYIASYVGRPFIFGFKALSKDVGLLTKNALAAFPSGHIFMSRYDVHITNGQSITALLGDKLQGELFNDISGDFYHNSFIAIDDVNNEAYICWPSSGSEWADRCITWNWLTGALSLRNIPRLSDIKEGVIASVIGIDTWEASFAGAIGLMEWDEAADIRCGSRAFESMHPEMVFASVEDDMIRRSGGGIYTIDGLEMEAEVERIGMDLGDPGSVKRVNAVWPRISTTGDTTVDIYLCGTMSPDDPPDWGEKIVFNPVTQSKVSCRITGKYFGWKIKSKGYLKWECHGVEFNVEPGGQRGSRIQ